MGYDDDGEMVGGGGLKERASLQKDSEKKRRLVGCPDKQHTAFMRGAINRRERIFNSLCFSAAMKRRTPPRAGHRELLQKKTETFRSPASYQQHDGVSSPKKPKLVS